MGRLELDIVALTSNVVVVVEVRMRGATSWQSALQSVDGKKQARVRAAGTSLWKSAFSQMAEFETMRFDIIAVDLSGGEPVIEHLIAAF